MFRYEVRNMINLDLLDSSMRELGLYYECGYEKEYNEFNFMSMLEDKECYIRVKKLVIDVDLSPLKKDISFYSINLEDCMTNYLLWLEKESEKISE